MSTNDDPETPKAPAEEVQQEDTFRKDLQEAVANDKKLETETPPEAPNADEAPVEEPKPDTPLTTEPEHDLAWYKTAYDNSTKEALRLKGELDKKVETPPVPEVIPPAPDEVLTPDLQLYVRGMISKDTAKAFTEISEEYPALKERETYDKFVAQAKIVGKVISETENRLPEPEELYEKTVKIMGLKPDNSEAIGSALKNTAGAPRTSSAPASPPPPSKVTEEMIAADLKHYPGKSRQEIIAELEPHIN